MHTETTELTRRPRRPNRTLDQKIADLHKEQEAIKNRKKDRQRKIANKKTGKLAKKNTLAAPLNTNIVSKKAKEMEEEMKEVIEQKQITDTQIKKALDETEGNVAQAAKRLRLHDTTLYRKIRLDPELAEYLDLINQRMIDMANEVVRQKLRDGDAKVALFVLETKGNYTKKSVKEITGGDKAVKVENTTKEAVNKADAIIKKSIAGLFD